MEEEEEEKEEEEEETKTDKQEKEMHKGYEKRTITICKNNPQKVTT